MLIGSHFLGPVVARYFMVKLMVEKIAVLKVAMEIGMG